MKRTLREAELSERRRGINLTDVRGAANAWTDSATFASTTEPPRAHEEISHDNNSQQINAVSPSEDEIILGH
jgi:hypothetical protein